MANFDLKLWQDRSLMSQVSNLNSESLDSPSAFVIQLRVHHLNNNPMLRRRRPPISKPVVFFYRLDSYLLSYQGMLHFLANILSGEGIQFENNGRFLRPNRLRNLEARPQSEPICSLPYLAEYVRRYAWLSRNSHNNIYGGLVKLLPMAMDLTIGYQQFQLGPVVVEETLLLDGHESLSGIRSNRMAPAVRLVEGTIQCSCTEVCSICLEKFEVGQLTCCTPCAHVFHKKCIAPWVKKSRSCPLCRADLSIHG